jgi:pectinesterase
MRRMGSIGFGLFVVCWVGFAQGLKTITVGATGADFKTIQEAVNAAPDSGAVIEIKPGVYREVVHVDKPKI